MMLMKKKNAVAAMIILFICVAVYLNWSYTQGVANGDVTDTSKTLGDEVLVNDEQKETQQDKGKKTDDKKASKDSNDYFTNARLERQKARDNALSILKDTVNEKNLSQESRDKAAANMESLASSAVSESRIESMIKAKGFVDCVALINDENVNIIVQAPNGGLTASDSTKIKDIVVTETSVKPSKIKIVEIK